MPTIISHVAVPLAARLGFGAARVSGPLLAAGMLAAIVPDFDVLAFKLGIPYADAFGHRGASHSILFAFFLGAMASAAATALRTSRPIAFLFVFAAAVSHPLLDMCTNGGLGVALFWPWSDHRYFFSWRAIEVSPIGVHGILGTRGITVIASELRWVWLPTLAAGAGIWLLRRASAASRLPALGQVALMEERRE